MKTVHIFINIKQSAMQNTNPFENPAIIFLTAVILSLIILFVALVLFEIPDTVLFIIVFIIGLTRRIIQSRKKKTDKA